MQTGGGAGSGRRCLVPCGL